MATKEQKLWAAERFLQTREKDGQVISLEDDMTYADFAVINDKGVGIAYVAPDGDTEYRISRDDFERDAVRILSHYGGNGESCDVYPIVITFMFIDDDETKALARCHYRPPFKEEE